VKFCSIDELLAPSDLLFTIDSFKKLLKSFGLFLLRSVCDDFNDSSIFLRNPNSTWFSIKEFEAEDLVSLLLGVLVRDDIDFDLFLAFLMRELKHTRSGFIVDVGFG